MFKVFKRSRSVQGVQGGVQGVRSLESKVFKGSDLLKEFLRLLSFKGSDPLILL